MNHEPATRKAHRGMRVLRWEIPVDDQWHQIGGGRVLHTACRPPSATTVHIWTLEPENTAIAPRHACVIGTGHRVPMDAGDHLGTAITHDDALVWHVFEQRPRGANR
jgi:hypothetical protein